MNNKMTKRKNLIWKTRKKDITESQVKQSIETYNTQAKLYATEWEWSEIWEKGTKKFFQTFFKYVEKGSVVLVAGCGTGRDISVLQNNGYRCVGIDASEGMLKEAARRIHAPLERVDIRRMKFVEGPF